MRDNADNDGNRKSRRLLKLDNLRTSFRNSFIKRTTTPIPQAQAEEPVKKVGTFDDLFAQIAELEQGAKERISNRVFFYPELDELTHVSLTASRPSTIENLDQLDAAAEGLNNLSNETEPKALKKKETPITKKNRKDIEDIERFAEKLQEEIREANPFPPLDLNKALVIKVINAEGKYTHEQARLVRDKLIKQYPNKEDESLEINIRKKRGTSLYHLKINTTNGNLIEDAKNASLDPKDHFRGKRRYDTQTGELRYYVIKIAAEKEIKEVSETIEKPEKEIPQDNTITFSKTEQVCKQNEQPNAVTEKIKMFEQLAEKSKRDLLQKQGSYRENLLSEGSAGKLPDRK